MLVSCTAEMDARAAGGPAAAASAPPAASPPAAPPSADAPPPSEAWLSILARLQALLEPAEVRLTELWSTELLPLLTEPPPHSCWCSSASGSSGSRHSGQLDSIACTQEWPQTDQSNSGPNSVPEYEGDMLACVRYANAAGM